MDLLLQVLLSNINITIEMVSESLPGLQIKVDYAVSHE
jgi:cytosine/uracil/thiamine/allantoin permease